MRNVSTSLVIWEMQIKINSHAPRWLQSKKEICQQGFGEIRTFVQWVKLKYSVALEKYSVAPQNIKT
jgi:hypothetical protein